MIVDPWGGQIRESEYRNHLYLVSQKAQEAEKATLVSERGLYLCRQLPTLPHTFACSTIGPAGLNFRVRDGNGWIPRGMITDNLEQLRATSFWLLASISRHTFPCWPERVIAANLICRLPPHGLSPLGGARSQELEAEFQRS